MPVRKPAVDDEVTFAAIPGETFRITHITKFVDLADGWGYAIRGEDVATGHPYGTTLALAEHGPTGWEYVR